MVIFLFRSNLNNLTRLVHATRNWAKKCLSRLFEEPQTPRKTEQQLDPVKIECFLQLTICRITSGNQTLNHCQMYMIEKEGFPVYRDPFRRGNLIIQILIDPINTKRIPSFQSSQAKYVDRIKKLFNVPDFEENILMPPRYSIQYLDNYSHI